MAGSAQGMRETIGRRPPARSGALWSVFNFSGQAINGCKVWLERLAQLRQFGGLVAAVEKRPADFKFEILDALRQRRLRHAAAACGAGEILFVTQGEEVADLGHFHDGVYRLLIVEVAPLTAATAVRAAGRAEIKAPAIAMA
jgi:hypothetical protein